MKLSKVISKSLRREGKNAQVAGRIDAAIGQDVGDVIPCYSTDVREEPGNVPSTSAVRSNGLDRAAAAGHLGEAGIFRAVQRKLDPWPSARPDPIEPSTDVDRIAVANDGMDRPVGHERAIGQRVGERSMHVAVGERRQQREER